MSCCCSAFSDKVMDMGSWSSFQMFIDAFKVCFELSVFQQAVIKAKRHVCNILKININHDVKVLD